MILKLQLLVIFTFSLSLIACTEDRNFDTDEKTVDIRLDNSEEITLGVVQSTFLTHLYLPIFDFLGESDLPADAVKVENITLPDLMDNEDLTCLHFPERTSNDTGTAFYCHESPNGGVALYRFPAEQEYVSGDKIEVKYQDYKNELGWVQNGNMTAKYLKTDGINSDFVEADSVSCLVNVQAELKDQAKIDDSDLLAALLNAAEGSILGDTEVNGVPLSELLPTRDINTLVSEIRLSSQELNSIFLNTGVSATDFNGVGVIDVVGDSVNFIALADTLKIEVVGRVQVFDDEGNPVLENGLPTFEIITDGFGEPILDKDDEIQVVKAVLNTFYVDEDDEVIVINHSTETTTNPIASIDQDQVFSISKLNWKEVSCQHYDRELSASLTNLSVEKEGITYEIDGSARLVEGTLDYISFAREVRNSSFTTTVTQENSIEEFMMKDFDISYVQGSEFGSFSFDSVLSGSISSSLFPGKLEVFQGQSITGHDGSERPTVGQFTIFGKGLERIFVTFKEFTLFISVDYNGDSTGNQRSDVDFRFEPNWDDLINRDFLRPDVP